MTNKIFAVKNTKAICGECGALIFQFCRDVYRQEKVSLDQIYPDRGFPQESHKPIRCACGFVPNINLRFDVLLVPPSEDDDE